MKLRYVAIVGGILVQAGPALAQVYEAVPLKPLSAGSMLYEWLYGLGFLLGCLVVAFKPAKRANLR